MQMKIPKGENLILDFANLIFFRVGSIGKNHSETVSTVHLAHKP